VSKPMGPGHVAEGFHGVPDDEDRPGSGESSGTFRAPASETIAASAPFPNASPTKSAPSARSPGSAMKTEPGPT